MLPGQVVDGSTDEGVKVIVPSKFKDQEETVESAFSRKDKLRSSFKDTLTKRYNNKKHSDVVSAIEKLQAHTAGKLK